MKYMSDNPIINEPINYDGTIYFNVNTWNKTKGFVTLENLKNYANLYSTNIFTSLNVFSAILTSSINGIPDTVLAHLEGVTSNIAESFNTIFQVITNVKYFQSNSTTYVEHNLYADDLATKNSINSSSLNVASINSSKIRTFDFNTKTMKAKEIVADNMIINNDVGVYLFVDIFFMPVMKTQSNLPAYDENTSIHIHLKPRYSVICKDVDGKLLLSLDNNTNDFLYFIPVSNTVKIIEVYLNGRKI
jgi:hypothetical protein